MASGEALLAPDGEGVVSSDPEVTPSGAVVPDAAGACPVATCSPDEAGLSVSCPVLVCTLPVSDSDGGVASMATSSK